MRMVSRRTFFTITSVMLVILFLFQAVSVIEDVLADYNQNTYANTTKSSLTAKDIVALSGVPSERNAYVAYLGDTTDGLFGSNVDQWCLYSKRALITNNSLAGLSWDENHPPAAIIIDCTYLNPDTDTDLLESFTQAGITLVFGNLPDSSVIGQNPQFQELLGIASIQAASTKLTGIQLMAGFLLGGDAIYQAASKEEEKRQDLHLETPWYLLHPGNKVYMMGLVADQTVTNDKLPPLIWRYYSENAFIFAMNGDYTKDCTVLGILSAIMAENSSFEIYPVINAQNLVFGNLPCLVSENEAKMQSLYNEDSLGVYRDLVWPTVATVALENDMEMTALLAPKLDYESKTAPSSEELHHYLKLVRDAGGEMGLSDYAEKGNVMDKLNEDSTFLQKNLPDFEFVSMHLSQPDAWSEIASIKELGNIRTVTTDYNTKLPLVSFLTDDITLQQTTNTGYTHTYSEDLRLRSIQTALGYSNIYIDLKPLLYPESQDDTWEVLATDFSSNLLTYWKPFRSFQSTTLSRSDQIIRSFMAADYSYKISGNEISLQLSNLINEVSFLLRCQDNLPDTIQGGTMTKIETGVYLIQANSKQVKITLKPNPELYYHE